MPLTTQAPLLNLDMPSWGYTANGVQLLVDGDMEAAGVAAWSVGNNATLTKQTTNPHAGYQCLRIAYNGVANPRAYQTVLTVGNVYRLTGWARGDGTATPGLFIGAAALTWAGTSSVNWQYFDVTATAASAFMTLQATTAIAGYVEFDDVRLEWCPASTRNLGTLGGYALLGDGVTVAGFPSQVSLTQPAPTHGMTFDGSSDYLRRAEVTNELTFTDPTQFSVEALCVRNTLAAGAATLFCKNGGGVAFSTPYILYVQNNAGTMQIIWASISSAGASRGIVAVALGNYWPAGVTTHVVGTYDGTTWRVFLNAVQAFTQVAAGCYAPDAASSPLYVGTAQLGGGALASYFGGKVYDAAVYPFALTPGEVAQLCRLRLGLLNRGS